MFRRVVPLPSRIHCPSAQLTASHTRLSVMVTLILDLHIKLDGLAFPISKQFRADTCHNINNEYLYLGGVSPWAL